MAAAPAATPGHSAPPAAPRPAGGLLGRLCGCAQPAAGGAGAGDGLGVAGRLDARRGAAPRARIQPQRKHVQGNMKCA